MSINNLPAHLLAQIFSYLDEWIGPRRLRHREPHVLTDVCAQWRDIAVNERNLWNKLHYDWELERGYEKTRVHNGHASKIIGLSSRFDKMALISSYLKRAAGRALYLIFNLHSQEPASPFAKVLQRCFLFLRYLSLSAPLAVFRALSMTTTTQRLRRARFPMLELLHLSMPYKNPDKALIRKFTSGKQIDLTGCGKLRDLTIDSPNRSFGFITDNLISGIPYSQLSELSITDRGLSPTRGREILIQCTSLVRCFLKISQWEENEVIPLSPAPMILAHLRCILVKFSGKALDGQISPFFRALTLPALNEFTITAPYAADEEIIDELIRLQIRSCAPIRLLRLIDIVFSYDEVSNFFRLLPQLQYLQIGAPHNGYCHSYAKILTEIRYNRDANNDSENILPNLTKVHIADNLSDQTKREFTRWLAAGFNPRKLDVSHALGDHEVLDAIENRCWRRGVTPASVISNVVGSAALKSLRFVEILWRNVPLEWLSIKRCVKRRIDEMEEIYPININISLES